MSDINHYFRYFSNERLVVIAVLCMATSLIHLQSAFAQKSKTDDLEHGERQLKEMIRDRPSMGAYVQDGDAAWLWTRDQFAGHAVGLRVFWDSTPPSSGLSSCYARCVDRNDDNLKKCMRRRSANGFIRIAERDARGEFLNGDYLWSCAIYELFNVTNSARFADIEEQVLQRKLTRDKYVREIARLEFGAGKKTTSFYKQIWLPLIKQYGLSSKADNWYVGDPPSFDEYFEKIPKSMDYYRRYAEAYDETIQEQERQTNLTKLLKKFKKMQSNYKK